MLQGLSNPVLNPALHGTAPAVMQILATLLFCAVFLFLKRRSGVVYFAFWSLAWAVESLALICSFAAAWSGSSVFLWFRALFEFLFALSLVIAAQSAATATARGFRSSLRTMLLIPGLLLLAYVFAWRLPLPYFRAFHASVLALVYWYSFFRIGMGTKPRKGIGEKMMRFTLACLFLQYLAYAWIYTYTAFQGGVAWLTWLRSIDAYDLLPQTLLAFSAMAKWMETQQDTVARLRVELDVLERTASGSAELDHLTGLQNRMALDRHLDTPFNGVVAVCDLDYFKDINDRFGHLVGDEVLRSVGNLIRASIRAEDEAFRWGGDEFVIVFRRQHIDLARGRMAVLEERLQTFRIRGHGPFPLGLSWGAAEGDDQVLRPILEAADRQMYERKRTSHTRKA